MRIFIAVLILIFNLQSWTKADDIRDFEIEGMSIGDSLLDYYSKEEINKFYENASYYKNKIFAEILLDKQLNEYDFIQVALQPSDNKFIIHSIALYKDFPNQIDKCLIEKEKVIKNSADILSNAKRVNENAKAEADKSGNSFLYISSFYLTSGGFFNIKCEDYGEEAFKSYGWIDTLSLSIGSEKFKKFLLRGDVY